MHGVAQQDTIELSDLSGICFYNRRRDSSTSGIGQRWYRCTERDLARCTCTHAHVVAMIESCDTNNNKRRCCARVAQEDPTITNRAGCVAS